MAKIYPLRELCRGEITDGTHKTPTYSESGYIFLSSKNVVTGVIDWENVAYIPEDLHKELYKRLAPQKDDILLAKNGTTGVAAIVDKEEVFDIYVSLALIRPNSDIIFPKYLLYAINSDTSKKYFNSHLKGIGVPNLHLTHIRETPISVPSMNEQKHISAIFDKVHALISLRKQQLAKLDELVKARFVEMFGESRTNPKGWQTIELQAVADVGSSKRVFVEELQDTGIPFFRSTEIGALAEGRKITPELFITQEHYQSLCESTGAPTVGDLLMPSICPDGRIWLVDDNSPFYFKDGRVLWVHPTNKNINSCYLQHALKEKIMVDYASIASGTTFAELKIFVLKILQIMVPPLKQQDLFSEFVDKIERQKLTIQQSLDKMEVLKKSLMQEYFR